MLLKALTAALAASLFLFPTALFPATEGTGTWKEDGAAFRSGKTIDLKTGDGNLSLGLDREWTVLSKGQPIGADYMGMAFDDTNRKAVLFGGHLSNIQGYNQTWVYDVDKDEWNQTDPDACPVGRQMHDMVFDQDHGLAVMFGGHANNSDVNDTWTYNVSSNVWTNQSPAVSPPAREGHRMVYDDVRDKVIMFGGTSNGTFLNDTWSYDLAANNWTNLTCGTAPSWRAFYSMSFDSVAKKAVLFGGGFSQGPGYYTCYNDTWTFDPATGKWTKMSTGNAPSERANSAMLFDALNGRALLYGGYKSAQYFKDVWSYNSTSNAWTPVDSNAKPGDRTSHSMVYDGAKGQAVMFGGSSQEGVWPEYNAWLLDTASLTWTYREPKNPFWREAHDMAFDTKNGVSVLFGGVFGSCPCNDTWTHNATTGAWKNMRPAVSPPARQGHGMVYDERAGVTVVFGGYGVEGVQADTWTYNLSANVWTEMSPAQHPDARYSHAMAFDAIAGAVIMYGGWSEGMTLDDTWAYYTLNNTWKDLAPSDEGLYGRAYTKMAFDPGAGEMVLFGGYWDDNYCNDTWTYNYSRNLWAEKKSVSAPSIRTFPSMVYCANAGGVILFGGYLLSGGCANDTWVYHSADESWTRRNSLSPVSCRGLAAMTYDPVADLVVLFGGSDHETMMDDTWAYRPTGGFIGSGTYLSASFDSGGSAYFGAIGWEADMPPGTSVRFQFRASDSLQNLNRTTFIGPDGKASSSYLSSGRFLYSGHNGSRWFQYKAVLGTANSSLTPSVSNVWVVYNLMHDLRLTSPMGGEVWTGDRNITWNLTDKDQDEMAFDIILQKGGQNFTLAANLTNLTRQWTWNTTTVSNGMCTVRVVAKDHSPISLSASSVSIPFTISHPVVPNHPPTVTLLSPDDNASVRDQTVRLAWTGSDEDGDPLAYYVFFSRDRSRLMESGAVVAHLNETAFCVTGLTDGINFWTVVPNDGKQNGDPAPVRSLTVLGAGVNHRPKAVLLGPQNGSTVNATTVKLSWNGSDEDGDPLRYHVSTGEKLSDVLAGKAVVSFQPQANYSLSGLRDGAEYFWTVVPHDGKENGSAEPGYRSFKVQLPVANRAPRFTSSPVTNATIGSEFVYQAQAVDEDNDSLVYSLALGPANMSINEATGRISWIPDAQQKGQHQVVIGVSDGKDRAEQVFIVEVRDTSGWVVCAIIHPAAGDRVNGTLTVCGTAACARGALSKVELRLDNGTWMGASGTVNWAFELDTAAIANGRHTLEARAFDGANYSGIAAIELVVDNPALPPTPAPAAPWWSLGGYGLILVIAVIMVSVAAVALAVLSRKRARKQ